MRKLANPDRPRPGETPKAWALRFAASALDEQLYFFTPDTATRPFKQAARRLLERLQREAEEARHG